MCSREKLRHDVGELISTRRQGAVVFAHEDVNRHLIEGGIMGKNVQFDGSTLVLKITVQKKPSHHNVRLCVGMLTLA